MPSGRDLDEPMQRFCLQNDERRLRSCIMFTSVLCVLGGQPVGITHQREVECASLPQKHVDSSFMFGAVSLLIPV